MCVCIYIHTYIKLVKRYIYIFFKSGDIENYKYECNGDNSFFQQINYSYDLFVIFGDKIFV